MRKDPLQIILDLPLGERDKADPTDIVFAEGDHLGFHLRRRGLHFETIDDILGLYSTPRSFFTLPDMMRQAAAAQLATPVVSAEEIDKIVTEEVHKFVGRAVERYWRGFGMNLKEP